MSHPCTEEDLTRVLLYGFLLILDVINNPCTYFLGAILTCALNLNFGSTDISIQAGVDSLANNLTLFLQVKVLIEHSHRKDLCQGVSDVQALTLRPAAVDGLEDRRAATG